MYQSFTSRRVLRGFPLHQHRSKFLHPWVRYIGHQRSPIVSSISHYRPCRPFLHSVGSTQSLPYPNTTATHASFANTGGVKHFHHRRILLSATSSGHADHSEDKNDIIIDENIHQGGEYDTESASELEMALKYHLRSRQFSNHLFSQHTDVSMREYRSNLTAFIDWLVDAPSSPASTSESSRISESSAEIIVEGTPKDASKELVPLFIAFLEHQQQQQQQQQQQELEEAQTQTETQAAGPASPPPPLFDSSTKHNTSAHSNASTHSTTNTFATNKDSGMNPSTNSQSPPRSDPHRDPFSRRGESSKGQGRSTHDRAASKETMKSLSNLTLPHDWYPEARSMKRKIIMHVGPTNSGKTHQALQRLQEAESGIYCGPLRLLAWEVKEKLANDLNIPCNLLTGQEVERMDGANHVSCTVEMTNTSEPVDVCVIDEVQMIDSSDRGSAWTRALLGVPAKEIHVCGSPNLVNIVRELASVTGDAVEVNKYERLSPLKFGEPLQRGWKDVERGDCLVAFSRKDLYSIKRAVESSTEHKCCIIYGSLPPEVRKLQAELFNDPDSGYDVLVASDAIGMGLNLNMRRVIFGTIAKFDGTEVRDLLPSEALQIGGRAGRFNTEWSTGYVTTLFPDDYEDLKEIFATPIDPIKRAGLTPNRDVIQKIHERRPDLELNEILAFLSEYATLDELYFMCDLEDVFEICQLLAPVRGLEMDTLYNVCQAPVKIREKSHMRALRSFITDYVQHGVVTLDGDGSRDSFSSLPLKNPPATTEQIRTVENHWGVMDLYIWLSHRFPHAFVDQELATERRNQMADWIDVGLQLIETTSFEDRSKQRKKRKKKKKKKNPGYRNRR